MQVTVCEMNDDQSLVEQDWQALREHVRNEGSQLVLLPEMPFHTWLPRVRQFDPHAWQKAVQDHEQWMEHLGELGARLVLGTRPLTYDGKRLNEGFIWSANGGYQSVHYKYYLPDEEGFWEASWYQRGEADFSLCRQDDLAIGYLICSELWFMERGRAYGQAGAHLLATPRATMFATLEKWLVGGRAAAIVSGAYSISSNKVNPPDSQPRFGGQGWIIAPDGRVLAMTSPHKPFVTVDIDLQAAEQAKKTYPRYIRDI